MLMSDHEICWRVERNGGSGLYIKIIAQLNACEVYQIQRVLRRNGFIQTSSGDWKRSNTVSNSNPVKYTTKKEGYAGTDKIPSERIKIGEVKITGTGDLKIKERKKSMKLTGDDLKRHIAKEYKETGNSYKFLAKKYGVSTWFIGDSVRRFTDEISDKVDEPVKESSSRVSLSLLHDCLLGLNSDAVSGILKLVSDSISLKKRELQELEEIKKFIENSLLA